MITYAAEPCSIHGHADRNHCPGCAPVRKVRCQILVIHERRGANRCQSEALDPDGSLPMCAKHLAEACREYVRLTGNRLTIGDGG